MRFGSATHKSELIRAIENACKPKRRVSQASVEHVLDFLRDEEWQRWKNTGVVTAHSAATELIVKVKALGAQNLDEHNKKCVTAIYMFCAATRARRAPRCAVSVFTRFSGSS